MSGYYCVAVTIIYLFVTFPRNLVLPHARIDSCSAVFGDMRRQ